MLLGACAPAAAPGDAVRGRQLFEAPVASPRGEQPPCSRCHAVEKDKPAPSGLGTNFYDIGLRAANTVPSQSAEQYLRTGIVDPDAYLAGGFQDGLMYREYAKALTEQQIADLVAYMLTLRGGQ
jgi:cytochrome c553